MEITRGKWIETYRELEEEMTREKMEKVIVKELKKIGIDIHKTPWEEYDSTYKGQLLTQKEHKKIMEVVKEFDDLDYFYEDQLREDDAEAIINDLEEEGVDVSRFKTALERGEPRYEVVIEP